MISKAEKDWKLGNYRKRGEAVGAFVVEGDPLGIGFIVPEDEVEVEEREWGREV